MSETPGVVNTISQADLADRAKVQEKCATREEFKTLPGYREFHYEQDALGQSVEKPGPDAHGRFEWAAAMESNVQGTKTREFEYVLDVMSPFYKADVERHEKMQARIDRVALKDEDGGTRFVEPRLVAACEKANGWRVPMMRCSPNLIYRDGRWWRKHGREWRAEDGKE